MRGEAATKFLGGRDLKMGLPNILQSELTPAGRRRIQFIAFNNLDDSQDRRDLVKKCRTINTYIFKILNIVGGFI